jgi:hypothetical protein
VTFVQSAELQLEPRIYTLNLGSWNVGSHMRETDKVEILMLILRGLHEARLNNTSEFSPYLKENTTLHHHKDKLVNAA